MPIETLFDFYRLSFWFLIPVAKKGILYENGVNIV